MIDYLRRKWALYWRRLVCRFRGHEKLEHETETILAPTGLQTIPRCRFTWRQIVCLRCGQRLGARADAPCTLVLKDGREIPADFGAWRDLVVKACMVEKLTEANRRETSNPWEW